MTKKHAKKRRPMFFTCLISLILILLFLLFGFFKLKADLGQFFNHIQPEEQVLKQEEAVLDQKLKNKEPFSILLIGTDLMHKQENRGRADTIMLASINPQEESIKLVSIPRDTLIRLPGTEEKIEDKINATYVYGYVPYLKETVEEFLDIPVDSYAILNYEGLIRLVDEVGGINVHSNLSFEIVDDLSGEIQTIEEGYQHLNGRQALAYARMRKEDPQGDYGRQSRQREIVTAVLEKLIKLDNFTRYKEILNSLGHHCESNIKLDQAYKIFTDYRQAAQDIQTSSIVATESSRYFPHYGLEVFVFEPDFFPLKDLKEELAQHLNVEGQENTLDEHFDYFIDGFPFYSDNAVEELDLEEFVDPKELEESEEVKESQTENLS